MLKKSVTPSTVLTPAARRALHRHGRDSLSDLRFLEQWATNPSYNAATILRAGQIRRTNPDLMQDIDTGIRQEGTRKALR